MHRVTPLLAMVGLILAAGALAALGGPPLSPVRASPDDVSVFLPLALVGARFDTMEAVPTAARDGSATSAPADTPTDTATPEPTGTVEIPPTMTSEPTYTPTATEPAVPSRIFGRITVSTRPIAEGFGVPGGPQIELRRCARTDRACVADEWEVVDHTLVVEEGRFEFRNPPPLAEGERYQVWWTNDFEHVDAATSEYLGRWWSRPIEHFGPGDEVDVGVFEVADLKLREICHDCGQSLPITFKWAMRPNRAENYLWSLFRGCGSIAARYGAYRTASLGHHAQYELASTPPGFRLNEKYCWYIFIDDGRNGTGWSFDDWRVTFLTTP
jgi:hypothetical protein